MGKRQFCRICRTEKNLKYTSKELRQLNKKQLMLAYATQHGEANRASKKLLLTTPTLGNICQVCDERIQIFHRLDDGCHESCSDVEIEVVENTNDKMPVGAIDSIQKGDFTQITQRPETPVIVDDDDMLFNMFMQKFDQKTHLQRNQLGSSLPQNQIPVEGQFVNQFHTTYTPPQSTAGGSEGDETKVIEVLTSRESTPAPITTPATHTLALQPPPAPSSHPISNSNLVDAQGHRIVAIIELDDVDENESRNNNEDINHSGLLTPATSSSNELSFTESVDHRSGLLTPIKNGNSAEYKTTARGEDDDEEIVFRKVDTTQENPTSLKKRKRKSYDEKELRLVASLSLVSSDSETEDSSPLKVQVQKLASTATSTTATETAPVISKNGVTCKVCKIKLPDSESLSVHDLIHQGVKCVLCQVGFQQVKRLIYHMRRKHREYNGDALSEKPRSGQDSCMTIRLRYMQRTTFYECQLCGRIDEIFREHKDHIIEKHANESKTLKDPIMKQLKCPICKVKCGAQYLSLCRHLISTHDYQQYKSHLRELVHVSAFGWNAARQQEVAKTAKIFQFVKRKTFFFECKICRKVVAGYLHHLRHVNKHQTICNEKTNEKTSTTSNEIPLPQNSSSETIPKSRNLNGDLMKKRKKGISDNLENIDNNSKKLNKGRPIKKSLQIEQVKVKQKANKILKPKVNDVQKPKLNVKQKGKLKKSPKNEEKLKKTAKTIDIKEAKNKTQIKIKLKPKEKLLKKIKNGEKVTKGKPKKGNTIKNKDKDKDNKKSKQKVKQNFEQKPQVKKVKVKPPIRQIELQKFKCKHCLKKIKGFHLYNLHLLRQHQEQEYTRCNKCNKIFSNSSSNLEEHIKKCPQTLLVSTRVKRKFSKQTSSLEDSSELCINKVPENNDSFVNIEYNNYKWLEDLLKLSDSSRESHNADDSNKLNSTSTALIVPKQSNLQCCYCLHLFANDQDLEEHTKLQHSQKQVLIKYKPFKTVCK